MAPKKAAAAPAVEKETESSSAEETKGKPKAVKLRTLGHPPTLSMVVEVLKKNSERKGTSVQAIRSRILAAHPTVDPMRLKFLLRSALNKGIEKGILIRPPNSSATGATGRFKLAKPGSKPKEGSDGKMSENVDPNVQTKEKTGKPKEKVKKVAKKTSKKPKTDKEESKEENTEEANETDTKEKTPEPKAPARKPKKEAAGKKDKGPAPAKKPKAKAAAGEEGAKPKKTAKKADSAKAEDSEEKPAAKSTKKGKK